MQSVSQVATAGQSTATSTLGSLTPPPSDNIAEMPLTTTISPTPSLSRGSSGPASDSEAKSLIGEEIEVEYEETDGSELSEGQEDDEEEEEEEEVDEDQPPIPQPSSL